MPNQCLSAAEHTLTLTLKMREHYITKGTWTSMLQLIDSFHKANPLTCIS